MAAEVFEDDPAATGVLAVIGDLADPDAAATLVTAAQEAIAAGTLVMITPAAGLAGFCASLHAEHPSLGITLIRTANSMAGLLAAQRYAAAEAGQFRELVLDTRGEPREPLMVAGGPGAPARSHRGPGSREPGSRGPRSRGPGSRGPGSRGPGSRGEAGDQKPGTAKPGDREQTGDTRTRSPQTGDRETGDPAAASPRGPWPRAGTASARPTSS